MHIPATVREELDTLLANIRATGAVVKLGPVASASMFAEAERELGFSLPDDYKAFLQEIGSIEIELVYTWYVYGLPENRDRKKEYEEVFERCRADIEEEFEGAAEDPTVPYFPRRFVVLADAGLYDNAGSGFVWDGELEQIRYTAGIHFVERWDSKGRDFWALLLWYLEDVYCRLADPDDGPWVDREQFTARRRLPATPPVRRHAMPTAPSPTRPQATPTTPADPSLENLGTTPDDESFEAVRQRIRELEAKALRKLRGR